MRLPWLQVEQDAFERAVELASLLEVSEAQAIGHMVWLWRWALSRPDPELSGEVAGQHAIALVEAGARWHGKPGAFVEALRILGLVSKCANDRPAHALRVCGLDRYRAQLDKRAKDLDRKRKQPHSSTDSNGIPTESAEESEGTRDESTGKTQTQTQTQIKAAAAAPAVPLPAAPENPYASGSAFFAKLQRDRFAAGFAAEKPPRGLDAWFSEMLMELNGDFERVEATVRAWSADPYWRNQRLPTRGLMSQWAKYVPQQAAQPGQRCVICGAAAPSGWPDIGVPCCHAHANQAAEWCNARGLQPWVDARQWLADSATRLEVA